jgi:hypothetical protein
MRDKDIAKHPLTHPGRSSFEALFGRPPRLAVVASRHCLIEDSAGVGLFLSARRRDFSGGMFRVTMNPHPRSFLQFAKQRSTIASS